MPAGRPTKYKPYLIEKVYEYINSCTEALQIPYVEELSLKIDVDDDTIVEWCKKRNAKGKLVYPQFSAAIKKLKLTQKVALYRSSMEKSSAAGSIFQLKVNHGLFETSRQELTGKDGNDLKVNIINYASDGNNPAT